MKNFVEYPNELNRINDAAVSSPESFVLETEKAFHRDLRSVARDISAPGQCRLVLLFGPSSSGKTTASYLLRGAFREIGVGSTIISLDDFYRGESQAPLLPNGQHDYESVHALNVEELERCLLGLVQDRYCDMPLFNFELRKPYPHRRHVKLGKNEIAIVEGIHALNPVITRHLPQEGVRKIYISVKQGMRSGGKELFTANEMRLVRRIVRDYRFRGTPPERTLSMWPSVMEGERKYIKPYRSEVDYTINSLHLYESCVLKDAAAAILGAVPEESEQYPFARRLLGVLGDFVPISPDLVPADSLLREFIGGGRYPF